MLRFNDDGDSRKEEYKICQYMMQWQNLAIKSTLEIFIASLKNV